MVMKRTIFASAALLLGACATTGEGVDITTQAAVPFVSSTSVLEWRVLDQDTLYVRSVTNQWYQVETMGPCPRLRTGVTLGFQTARGTDELDRHGAILVQGSRCPLRSVTRSVEPPAEARG